MNPLLRYVNKKLAQMRKDKASPLIVSTGERELLKVKKILKKKRK